jgi:DNA polymerase elongation subunit (family B)
MKILLLDIETAPNLAYVWGLYKENIPIARLVESGYVLCFAAKWVGEERIRFNSIRDDTHPEIMLDEIHSLLDEADVVVHYNGTHFDIPTLNREFLLYGFTPPSPYYQVDLLKVARERFKFSSNKLEFIAKELQITNKVKHAGYSLWTGCMNNDPASWEQMEEYNKGDVVTLEDLYKVFLPWIKNHPNHGLYSDNKNICPSCGSTHYHKRGKLTTRAGIYERYHCQGCGAWFRGNVNQISPAKKHMLVAHC